MREQDPLSDLVRALREEGDAAAPQAKLTRERILRDLQPRAKARSKWAWALPLAAILAGSTVLAATGRLPGIVESTKRALGMPSDVPAPAPAPAPAPSAEEPAVTAASSPVPPTEPALDVPALPEPTTVAPPPRKAPRTKSQSTEPAVVTPPPAAETAAPASTESAPAAPTAPPAPETDEALALYRKAHRLHFVDQNPAAALAAWDAYLAANPKSPLVADARYDRAVCLVRLGRTAEARAALTPFAGGRYGAYRQKDAQALLGALPSE